MKMTMNWYRSFIRLWDYFNQTRMLETWHDAQQIREEALDRFSLGLLDLKTRAQIERFFWSIARKVYQMTNDNKACTR